MNLQVMDCHFSGEDPIVVIDFLVRFVRKENIQKMSEVQNFMTIPSFIASFAKSQHDGNVEMVSPDEG